MVFTEYTDQVVCLHMFISTLHFYPRQRQPWGASFCMCVCLFFHMISKNDTARITKFDIGMFHHESWKAIYFGVNKSKVRVCYCCHWITAKMCVHTETPTAASTSAVKHSTAIALSSSWYPVTYGSCWKEQATVPLRWTWICRKWRRERSSTWCGSRTAAASSWTRTPSATWWRPPTHCRSRACEPTVWRTWRTRSVPTTACATGPTSSRMTSPSTPSRDYTGAVARSRAARSVAPFTRCDHWQVRTTPSSICYSGTTHYRYAFTGIQVYVHYKLLCY